MAAAEPPPTKKSPHLADAIAGLSVAALMLPESVAYAGIAGLSPARALTAAVAGSLVYAVIGRSRFAILSPTSSSAAILAAAIGALGASAANRDVDATIMVGMTGILFLAAAVLRLGALASFVSRPVLKGFAFGLAITIVIRQLPALLGIAASGSTIGLLTWKLLTHLGDINAASALTGAAALAGLIVLRRWPRLPGALVVLAAGIVGSVLIDLPGHGVAVIGPISVALAAPHLTMPDGTEALRMLQLVAPLTLILFAESWGTMRTLAIRHGDTVAATRELGSLGLANLASGAAQGMPVGAGFSVGSANEAAGATSRWSAAIAGIALAALIATATPLIAVLPEPVLAAVVIAALTHALDPTSLVRLWRLKRDGVVALTAVAGVLILGVINGMLLAILLSIAAFIRRASLPHVARLGRLGDSHDYVSIARHPEAILPRQIAIWRPDEPLFFANAEQVFSVIARGTERAAHTIVLSLEQSFDLDSTALDALAEFANSVAARGIELRLARVRDDVRDLITLSGQAGLADRSFYSVADAVAAPIIDQEAFSG